MRFGDPGRAWFVPRFGETTERGMPLVKVKIGASYEFEKVFLGDTTRSWAPLEASTSGAVVYNGACSPKSASNDKEACVRHRDGSMRPIVVPEEIGFAYGPSLSGGLVVSTWEDELARTDAQGQRKPIAPLGGFTAGLIEAIDEVDDRTIHVITKDGDGRIESHRFAGKARTSQRLGTGIVRYAAGRGFVYADGALRITADAGATWTEVAAPPGLESSYSDRVSEVGLRIGNWGRIGWGPEGAVPASPAPANPQPTLSRPAPARGPDCTTGKPNPKILAPRGAAAALDDSVKRLPPRKGRTQTIGFAHRHPAAEWEAIAARAAADARLVTDTVAQKTEWTLLWVDRNEVGAKVRSGKGTFEGDLDDAKIEFVVPRGDHALFGLAVGKRRLVGRVSAGKGTIDPSVTLPAVSASQRVNDAAFAKDGAVAWFEDKRVWVWLPRESPRAIARTRFVDLQVGAPAKGVVPLLAGGHGWASYAELPIPKAASGDPPFVPLRIWTAAPYGIGEAGGLRVCGAKDAAPTFTLSVSSFALAGLAWEPPKEREDHRTTVSFVRADAKGACLAGFVVAGNKHFARADLVGGKAEGDAGTETAALVCKAR